jgi:hypothetical protein
MPNVTGPGVLTDAAGNLIAAGAEIVTGAAAGLVLTSDSAGDLAWGLNPLALPTEPATVVGVTVPRTLASGSTAALTSGTVYACGIALNKGVTVSNVSLYVAGTAEATGTHAWVGLANSARSVLAVSADNTGAAYFGGTNTAITTALAAPFTTTYAGLHYVFVNVTATTTPVFAAAPALVNAALGAVAPILCGTSSTGQTTPPATGTTLTAITATAGHLFYAWLT